MTLFTLGVVLGLILGFVIPRLPVWFREGRESYEKHQSYPRRVASAGTPKALLSLVICYIDDPLLQPLIRKLESPLDKEAFKALKKEIITYLKAKGEWDVRSTRV